MKKKCNDVSSPNWLPGEPGYLGNLVPSMLGTCWVPAGTVPYALQSLPGDIWLKIVDHTGRRDGLRHTCRKLMGIIPAFYRAEVTGSDDLGCFTEFLRSRVGHLYGVDVCMDDSQHRHLELDKFCAASSAFVAALAQCPDLHILRMRILTIEPATVAQLPVRTLDFYWGDYYILSGESRERVVTDFLLTMKNSCSIHTLNIYIDADTDDDLYFLSEPSSCSSLGLQIMYFHSQHHGQWDKKNKTMEAMAVLKGNPAVCSLTIINDCCGDCFGYGDALAMAISQLRFSGSIHTLHLDFDDTRVTNIGAVCLSQLRESPALRTLILSLRSANRDNQFAK